MNSRLIGVCLSVCSAPFAFAFVAPTRNLITRLSCMHYSTPRHGGGSLPFLQWLPLNSPATHLRGDYSHCKPLSRSSSVGSTAKESLPQDLGEMFDVYLPPESLAVITEPLLPAGFTKARGSVHVDGDWHRSVHIWLHNSKGEVVVQRRAAGKDIYPGMWDVSVGGHFSAGDTSLETAVKETGEELGIECDDQSLTFVCTVATSVSGSAPDFGDFVCNEFKDIYLLHYDGAVNELKYAPSEVEEVKLVPVGELETIFKEQDPAYIPRPSYYFEPLVKAIKEATD